MSKPLDNQVTASNGERVCVIGAGSSGLTVSKNLRTLGVPFDCLERETTLGGNWSYGSPVSSVYRSTHLISSKQLTEYADYPMPESYPEFPHHTLVAEYLQGYAEQFDLLPHIQIGVGVRNATRVEASGWDVELDSGERRRYSHLIVANGHNWDPRWPEHPGSFDGLALHSCQYKTPDAIAGKRVLVVGGGNSGCDIAVECGQNAARTCLSLRRGYHFLPKFFHGTPIDICGERMLRWKFPLPVRRTLAAAASFLMLGGRAALGLPRPDHRLFETHPVINSQLIYHLGHGDIAIRPEIAELCGDSVKFSDGTVEPFDAIIYATGFKISLPFLDSSELTWREGRPDLYLNVFSPHSDDLFFAGLIQPDSGQFGLVDYQAQLIAAYLHGLRTGSRGSTWFREEKKRGIDGIPNRIRYLATPRHALEVEHFSYRRRLKKLIRKVRKT